MCGYLLLNVCFLIIMTFWMSKQVLSDVDCGKEFILCEYNRDADSYRLIIPTRCL